MRKLIPFALVAALCPVPSFADDGEFAPGDKWLECYIGKGGHDSQESLFAAVMRALDAGDGEALRALGLDQCAYFRSAMIDGWSEAETGYSDARRIDLERVRDLQARLQVEKVRLADHLASDLTDPSDEEDFADFTRKIRSTTSPLPISFTFAVVDERWYLTGMPELEGNGAPVVTRAKKLFDSLGTALGKHKKNPAAAKKTLDGWWKKSGAEFTLVLRAARTVTDGTLLGEYQAAKDKLVERVGPLKDDAAIYERLAAALPYRITPVGVPACDRYIAAFVRCAAAMPAEVRSSVENAMAQAIDAWREAARNTDAHDALNSGCEAALDSFATIWDTLCPDVMLDP